MEFQDTIIQKLCIYSTFHTAVALMLHKVEYSYYLQNVMWIYNITVIQSVAGHNWVMLHLA